MGEYKNGGYVEDGTPGATPSVSGSQADSAKKTLEQQTIGKAGGDDPAPDSRNYGGDMGKYGADMMAWRKRKRDREEGTGQGNAVKGMIASKGGS